MNRKGGISYRTQARVSTRRHPLTSKEIYIGWSVFASEVPVVVDSSANIGCNNDSIVRCCQNVTTNVQITKAADGLRNRDAVNGPVKRVTLDGTGKARVDKMRRRGTLSDRAAGHCRKMWSMSDRIHDYTQRTGGVS